MGGDITVPQVQLVLPQLLSIHFRFYVKHFTANINVKTTFLIFLMQFRHAIDHFILISAYLPCDIELAYSHSYHTHNQDLMCILLTPSVHSCTDPYMMLSGTRLKITTTKTIKNLLKLS